MNKYKLSIGFLWAVLGCLGCLGSASAQTNVNTRVLVLNPSGGYSHTTAINTLSQLLTTQAAAWNLTVTPAASASNFTLPYLRGFDVVVLNNNTSLGQVITGAGQTAFAAWMQEGGGAYGMHGAMDHSDSWKWYTDNMAMTKFAGHSAYCAQQNAMVQVDTMKTAGAVRAQKPEYAALVAALPKQPWAWCDEWYSLTSNPRNLVDVLITIDEKTYVPSTAMGDHPVAWTLKLPAGANGKQGKYFYTARGHDTPNFADANTRTMIRFALCWAAGLSMGTNSCQTGTTGLGGASGERPVSFATESRHGGLKIDMSGEGRHEVTVATLAGRTVARAAIDGDGSHAFAGLDPFRMYLVQVKSGGQVLSRRVSL